MAEAADGRRCRDGVPGGAPDYMAPEKVGGGSIDAGSTCG